jgi:DNA-binding MarR family transcriptional regulator
METHDTLNRPVTRRMEILGQLRDAIEEMGWQNLRDAERLLAPYHLTFPQAIVLSMLHRQGPDLAMATLAAQTGLPASTITSIMDRLVARELVSRRHQETDRRKITGSLTKGGMRLVDELEAQRRQSLVDFMEGFSEEELSLMTRLVERWTTLRGTDTNAT